MANLTSLAVTAASLVKAVPELVATTTGESSMRGIWALVGIALTVAGTVAVAMIKQWGPWKRADQDAETQLRSEMWKDIEALKLSKEDTSRRLTMAEARIAGQTIRLGQQDFVITMLIDEIERISPGNTIARSARALLKMQGDMMPHAEEIAPMADILAKMCKIDEEDEKP